MSDMDLSFFDLDHLLGPIGDFPGGSELAVPGGEVTLERGSQRLPLASTSSSVTFSEDEGDQSEGSVSADPNLELLLNEFTDIEALVRMSEQPQNTLSDLPLPTVDVGCHGGNYLVRGHDEMWNATHSPAAVLAPAAAASPAVVTMVPQAEAASRAPKRAEMGNSPSPDRDSVSGPAPKRARLTSDESITSVLEHIERKREKNNEACRRARQNKRTKERELKEAAMTLEKDNERLRKKIASLERKVGEEKKKFLQMMTSS